MFNLIRKITDKVNESMKREVDIEYDLSDSFISVYGDAYGVGQKRKKYLRDINTRSMSYFTVTIIRLLTILALNVVVFWLFMKNGCTVLVCILMCLLPFLYFVLAVNIIVFLIHVSFPSSRIKGHFKLSKEGLTDYTSDGIRMTFEWRKIKMIVIKRNAVVILTDTPCYFFVNSELQYKLVSEIKRFKSNIVVIRQDD